MGTRRRRDETAEGSAGGGLRLGSRVTICGSVTRDIVHRHRQETRQVGGTVWFAGTTLVDLGFDVRVLTRLAASDRQVAEAFRGRGVELQHLPSAATTTFHNIYGPGGRDDRRQRVEAVARPMPLSALRAALVGADLCYLGPLHPRDFDAEALHFLQGQREFPMAMDVQGLTRRIEGERVRPEVAPELTALLAACAVVKASAVEASLISGESDRERAALRLAELAGSGEVLVTCGRDGVLLARGRRLHRQAAAPLDDPDPTGAGDICLASYLAKRLGGEAPEVAVAFAVGHTARRLCAPDRVVRLKR